MRVNDLFPSIQGEGLWTGMPMTFLRLQGCNLNCRFCDTREAITLDGGEEVAYLEVFDLISDFAPKVVCVTGGEPTLQMEGYEGLAELCQVLHKYQYVVHLETNGTIALPDHHLDCFDWITVSPKGPQFKCEVPYQRINEIKFVIGDRSSTSYPSRTIIKRYLEGLPTGVPIWLQPDNNNPAALRRAQALINDLWAPPLRLGISMQMHKMLKIK